MSMKVAHLCTSGFSYKILVDKLALLQKRGNEVHIVSSHEGYDEELMNDYSFNLKFIYMNRRINLKDDLISIFRMVQLFRREKYEVVHTHTAKAGIIGRIAARIARIPVIIHTTHGLPFYEGQDDSTYTHYRLFEKIGAFFGDAIASQNKEDMDKLKEVIRRKPILYEGNGVDLSALDDRRQNITSDNLHMIREKLSIPPTAKVILVGARFEPVKDHAFLLDGLRELKKYHQDFVCLLAGRGPLEGELKSKIREYNLDDEVIMIGHQIDIYPYAQLADIIALTSEKEGLPRIIMEGMAFSKPVVATDVLGSRELVVNGENGILVEYRSVEELTNAFHELLSNDKLRVAYGEAGRKAVEENFTEEKVVDRIEEMYEELRK